MNDLDLARHQRERNLVTLHREAIDEHGIQGYVVAASAALVVVQHVYDFHLEGLVVVRTADLTEVACTDADRFQRALLAAEGLEQAVPFDKPVDLRDWRSAIAQLAAEFDLLAVECEGGGDEEDDFVIGRVLRADDDAITLRSFDGLAEWLDEPVEIAWADVTCCQFGSNYLGVYRRHFERQPR